MKMRTVSLLFACQLLLVLGCQPSGPQMEIHAYLERQVDSGFFSGVVLVAHEDEPVLELAFGMADRNHGVPNQMETKFNLGSMNKMITAVAILQLVESGQLDLEDTILDYLPDYPNLEIASQVTIHQLLTHTSGLGTFFNQRYLDMPKSQIRTLDDYLPLFVDQPLGFEPGSDAAYSNAGYLVLGLIIEEISGMSYYDFVEQNIFQTCGMTHSGYYQVDEIVENLAVGYTRQIPGVEGLSGNVTMLPGRGSSAGGGYSTAGDLLLFSVCIMEDQLLNDASMALMMTPHSQLEAAGLTFDYGYGVMLLQQNGRPVVGHGGGAPGICSNLDLFPTLGYTVVVLTNSDDDCRPVRLEIRRILTE
jgi:CubicO group peptidase (beta-lactamase class C family)